MRLRIQQVYESLDFIESVNEVILVYSPLSFKIDLSIVHFIFVTTFISN